jgi:hypothetical protein
MVSHGIDRWFAFCGLIPWWMMAIRNFFRLT